MKKILFILILGISTLLSNEVVNSYKNNIELSNEFIISKITYQQKKYNKSFLMFEKLFKENSDNAMINYYYAMSAIELKKDDIAMAALERVLIKKPDFNQARVEYARLLFNKGLKKEAKKEFEKVLLMPIPKNVRKNIEEYLKAIDNENKNLFLATIGGNIFYDDNLNSSFDSVITVPNSGDFKSTKESAFGASFYTQFSLLNTINEKYKLNNSFIAYKKAHFDNEEYDISFFSYKPTLIITNDATSAYLLSFSLDKFVAGDNKNFFSYLLEAQYKKIIDKVKLNIGYSFKDFIYEDDEELSFYTNKVFGNINFYMFNYDTSFSLNRNAKESTRTDINKTIFDNKLSFDYKILKNTALQASYNYTISNYSDKVALYNKNREDTKENITLGLAQNLTKETVMSFSYNYIKNESNIPIYSYDKQIYTLSYSRNFKW